MINSLTGKTSNADQFEYSDVHELRLTEFSICIHNCTAMTENDGRIHVTCDCTRNVTETQGSNCFIKSLSGNPKNRREAANFFEQIYRKCTRNPSKNTDPCASGDSRAPGFQKPLPEKKTMGG